jgi:hypothetical protein
MPTDDVWHRRGPNLEPGLVRELFLHHHKVTRHRSESAERAAVRVYTARSVPIREPARIQLAHAEHLGYETRFVCSATSTRGASRQPAHALHPLQQYPSLALLLWISLPASCAKLKIAFSRQHASGQLTAGKQPPVVSVDVAMAALMGSVGRNEQRTRLVTCERCKNVRSKRWVVTSMQRQGYKNATPGAGQLELTKPSPHPLLHVFTRSPRS